jgi:hypothetical protein
VATQIVIVEDVRRFMMDRPELNTLFEGVRWSSEDIDKAAEFVVDAFNSWPPVLDANRHTVETFPWRYLLLMGIAGHLLRGAAIGEASNHLTYSAAGVSVGDRDKASIFLDLGNAWWREFQESAKQIKVAQNVNGLLNHVGSEFRWSWRL